MELLPTAALRRCGIASDTRVLLALSGGADSTALLLLLHEAWRDGKIGELSAAHVHHGLRDAADADARFCSELCQTLSVPFFSAQVDVRAAAQAAGEGVELAARTLRYAALRQIKTQIGADCIVTAHHADDQAETVLLHLMRGSARKGLCGMQPRSDDLARPLLAVTHAQLLAYLRERKQPYCTDESNADLCFWRNRVRAQLLPMMETFNPRITQAICSAAQLLSEDEEYLAFLTQCLLEEAAVDGGYLRQRLTAAPKPIRRRALLLLLRKHCGAEYCRADAQRLDGLLAAQAGTEIELRGGNAAWNDGPILRLGRKEKPPAYRVPIDIGTERTVDGWRIRCSRVEHYCVPKNTMEACLCLDAFEDAQSCLFVRPRADGDRFQPLGCEGTKLVSDVYTDRKFSQRLRRAPLLFCGETLLFVPGYTVAESARVTTSSKTIIYISIEEDVGA